MRHGVPAHGCAGWVTPALHHALQGITMAMRDWIALAVVASGGLAAFAVWRPLGPWPALVLGLLAVVSAGVVYRLEPSTIRLGHWPAEADPDTRQDRLGHEDRVGQ